MKKKLLIISIIILVVVGVVLWIYAIANKNDDKETCKSTGENQFKAKVMEIADDYIMVEALDNQAIVGEVRVNMGLLKDDVIQQLKEGDIVLVTHDGTSTMSIPPQMTALELCVL